MHDLPSELVKVGGKDRRRLAAAAVAALLRHLVDIHNVTDIVIVPVMVTPQRWKAAVGLPKGLGRAAGSPRAGGRPMPLHSSGCETRTEPTRS